MTSKRGQLDGLGLQWRNSIRVADATRNLEDPDPWGSGLAGSWQQHLREGGLEFDQVTGSSLSLSSVFGYYLAVKVNNIIVTCFSRITNPEKFI